MEQTFKMGGGGVSLNLIDTKVGGKPMYDI